MWRGYLLISVVSVMFAAAMFGFRQHNHMMNGKRLRYRDLIGRP